MIRKSYNNLLEGNIGESTDGKGTQFRVSSDTPIEGYTAEEVVNIITPEIENILNENGVDNAAIAEVWLHGSRMRGDAKRNSDLDAVLFYKGDAREDDLFNIIADNAITIDGVKVDVNPIRIESDEDITRYKQKSQQYDAEKLSATNNLRFRVSDEATETIFTTAKDKFGTTYDMREAGYILPDGSMLDFSGKHEIRGADTSFLNGQRSVDHRAIQDIAYDFDENETGVKTDMGDFLDRGAIRIDYNTGAINLNNAPTKAQKDRLKRLIERNGGDVYIDFGKGWDTEHYVEYESARASRVLGDIDRYYEEGIKPSGNIRFRVADNTAVEQEQIVAEAKANGTYLKAPNGEPTNLTPKQWAMVRTKAFKNWFGDWELYFKKNFLLNGSPVATLNGDEFSKVEGKTLTDQVSEYFEQIGGKAISPLYGDVVLDRKGAEDSLTHGMGRNKAIAYAAVKEVIENGVLIDAHTNHKGRGYNTVVVAAPIEIKGERYACVVVIRRNLNENKFYLHEVTAQKNLLNDAFVTNSAQKPASIGDIANILQNIVSASDETSKIVDANGEPKVVYHRTPNKFTEFDTDKIGSSSDFGAFGNGFYFSPFVEQYRLYGKYKIAAFLNARNPFNLNEENVYDTKMAFGMSPEGQRGWTRTVSKEFTQWLKDNGYDAVVYKTDYNEEEDVVFAPNQIKSATENVGTFDAGNNDIRFRTAPAFYSNAERAVENIKQEKATPEQWLKMIEKNGGLKAGEDKWLGLSDWLKSSDKKTLTKQEVLDYIKANEIQIEEVGYGDLRNTSRFKELEKEYQSHYVETYDTGESFKRMVDKYGDDFDLAFSASGMNLYINDMYGTEAAETFLDARNINDTRLQYTTDGLDNKREIALTVPTIESWNENDEIHFGDAGNGRAIVWVRFGETTDAEGNRVLVIDEVQSKRHQEGREKGYISEEVQEAQRQRDYLYRKMYSTGLTEEESERYYQLGEYIKENYGIVPAAPFEKNWAELAMKRMLRYAAENGFDKVAWTKGEQQAERYDITKTISKIEKESKNRTECYVDLFESETGGIISFTVDKSSGEIIEQHRGRGFEGKNLSDVLGKSLAHEILSSRKRIFEQDNLRIGGEGMKAFYDQMLPSFMNKYGKKWGVKVEDVNLPNLEESAQIMHSVDVTPAMRESVMQGQPMFRVAQDKARFDELQQEYDALDKNDEAALNAWRDKKVAVVKGYLERIAQRFGMKPDIIVFNGADEAQMKDAYNRLVEVYRNSGEIPPSYKDFKAHSLRKEVKASYRKEGDIITFNTSAIDSVLDQYEYAESLFHEDAHHLAYILYSDKELAYIWDEIESQKHHIVELVKEKYGKRSNAIKGNEYIAKSIGYIIFEHRPLFMQFVRGHVAVEDVVKKLGMNKRIANFAVEEILNSIKYEYQARRESANDLLGGVGNGSNLRDSEVGVRSDERGKAEGGINRGRRRGRSILDAVSQNGLRGVVSEDALVSFFKGVYNRVDNATRNEIYEYVKRNGNDFWKGTEQYLASLAENENTPLDNGVRESFMRMLEAADIDSEGLTDNDIRYMLWRTNQLQNYKGALSVAEDVVMKQKLGINNAQPTARTSFRVADEIESLFKAAVAGDLTGKPISIGRLTSAGKEYLEKISGLRMKDKVDFVLNPSDLVHIYKGHFGNNETDARSIPLDIEDIRNIADVVSSPDKIIYAKERDGQKRNMFFFFERDR